MEQLEMTMAEGETMAARPDDSRSADPGLVGREPDDPSLILIQSRADVDYAAIDEYAALMRDGVEFEPAQAVMDPDEKKYFVWDGYHRAKAAAKAGLQLWMTIRLGTRQDAEWLSLTANTKHGLRRTRRDKQRVVRQALEHPNGVSLSDREIARHCSVDHKTVGRIRRELEVSGEIPQVEERTVTRGDSTYKQSVPKYAEVWELERSVSQWVETCFTTKEDYVFALEAIKRKTPDGKNFFALLLNSPAMPASYRKRDVRQACNNVLARLYGDRVYEALPCPHCQGRVFYSRNIAGLICRECLSFWTRTDLFRNEAVQGANPSIEPGGYARGFWHCSLCYKRKTENDKRTPVTVNGDTLTVCDRCLEKLQPEQAADPGDLGAAPSMATDPQTPQIPADNQAVGAAPPSDPPPAGAPAGPNEGSGTIVSWAGHDRYVHYNNLTERFRNLIYKATEEQEQEIEKTILKWEEEFLVFLKERS